MVPIRIEKGKMVLAICRSCGSVTRAKLLKPKQWQVCEQCFKSYWRYSQKFQKWVVEGPVRLVEINDSEFLEYMKSKVIKDVKRIAGRYDNEKPSLGTHQPKWG